MNNRERALEIMGCPKDQIVAGRFAIDSLELKRIEQVITESNQEAVRPWREIVEKIVLCKEIHQIGSYGKHIESCFGCIKRQAEELLKLNGDDK